MINEYIESFLSKILTGFRKHHNTYDFLFDNARKF